MVLNSIQYPVDWDNYTAEKKLDWLKNRFYWREYHQLKIDLHERLECKLVESDDICYKVLDSIIRNNGDKTKAEQLFVDHLNKCYMFKAIDSALTMKIKMEVNRMNDYIRSNYYSLAQFNEPVEYYYFNTPRIDC